MLSLASKLLNACNRQYFVLIGALDMEITVSYNSPPPVGGQLDFAFCVVAYLSFICICYQLITHID